MKHQSLPLADQTLHKAEPCSPPIRLKASSPAEDVSEDGSIVVIDHRVLIRDCISRCLRSSNPGRNVLAFGSAAEWKEAVDVPRPSVVLVCTQGHAENLPELEKLILEVSTVAGAAPMIMVSETEDLHRVSEALNHGVNGYIPTSVTLEVAICAMGLVQAGGTYVPASTVHAARTDAPAAAQPPLRGMFSDRQAAVIKALRQGKANKIIAYELNMCESTVKVHVRNIMKKLKAKNRTQVAFMANELFPPDAHR